MTNRLRPKAITEWIGSARSWTIRHSARITDIEAFGRDFHAWWALLQPAERQWDDNGHFTRDDHAEIDWTCLRNSGKDGLWTAVAGVCYWGIALGSDQERIACSSWQQAVADLGWVFVQLMRPLPRRSLIAPSTTFSGQAKNSKRGAVRDVSKAAAHVGQEKDLTRRPSTRATIRQREVESRPATRSTKRKLGDIENDRRDGPSVRNSKRCVIKSLSG